MIDGQSKPVKDEAGMTDDLSVTLKTFPPLKPT